MMCGICRSLMIQAVIVGLITQRDLYQIHSPRRLEDGSWYYDKEALSQLFILKNVMLAKPFTLKPSNALMRPLKQRYVLNLAVSPIVDDDKFPAVS